jgi:hypothetical protein
MPQRGGGDKLPGTIMHLGVRMPLMPLKKKGNATKKK